MDDSSFRRPYRFPRDERRHGPEAWVLDRLQEVKPRTWAILGGVVVLVVALGIWALVAAWQALGSHAPALRQAAGGLLGEVTSQADPAAAAGGAIVAGAAAQARGAIDQYAADLDRVVPGASGHLRAAAGELLGQPAEAG